jgi:hypothetical protein
VLLRLDCLLSRWTSSITFISVCCMWCLNNRVKKILISRFPFLHS